MMGPYQHLSEDEEEVEVSPGSGGREALGNGQNVGTTGAQVPEELPWWQFALSTLSLFAVQIVWTVELGFGTPYLLSLGVPKALISIVWLAGPLSGLLVQPIVGSYSDNATFKLGRRRPFVIGGTAVVCLSLLTLAYAYEACKFLVAGSAHPTLDQKAQIASLTRWVVVLSFWILDFSLNAVMASSRALIMDIAPIEQQGLASAFAGRQISLGNVFGYVLGFMNLPQVFPLLGDSQVTVLCLMALFILVICVSVTCITTKEVPHPRTETRKHWYDPLLGIMSAIMGLPPRLQAICNVLLFAWLGWFGFLFFSSSWVAEVTHGPIGLAPHIPPPNGTNGTGSAQPVFLWERNLFLRDTVPGNSTGNTDDADPASAGARAGSFALFVFAVVSLVFSFIIPPVSRRANDSRSFADLLPTVPRIWAYSIVLFSVVTLSTIFVDDLTGATICIALLGIPWATLVWAPFVMIGEYCRQELDARNANAGTREEDGQEEDRVEWQDQVGPNHVADISGSDNNSVEDPGEEPVLISRDDETLAPSIQSEAADRVLGRAGDKERKPLDVGTVMGISNLYVVVPQLVMTALSSVLFAVFHLIESARGLDPADSDAFGWVLRVGGLFAIAAAYLAFKLDKTS